MGYLHFVQIDVAKFKIQVAFKVYAFFIDHTMTVQNRST